MRRLLAALVALYAFAALMTRLVEAMGMRTCGCAADCWCKKPGLSAFRWVFPRGHHLDWPDDSRTVI